MNGLLLLHDMHSLASVHILLQHPHLSRPTPLHQQYLGLCCITRAYPMTKVSHGEVAGLDQERFRAVSISSKVMLMPSFVLLTYFLLRVQGTKS